jgi:hypothetical protein
VRVCYPFLRDDLEALERFYEQATAVVAMEDIYDHGDGHQNLLGVRHDCDNVIHPAVRLAEWEEARGYRSTYYILHTSPYWQDKTLLRESLDRIAECGHEIGIHNDALTVALETGRDPAHFLHEAVAELRYYGHTVRSTVAHGNRLCHIAKYVNDEMFVGCQRPDYGAADRMLEHGGRSCRLTPLPLAEFGLDFDANWIPRGDYLSDSGGRWSQPFDDVVTAWPERGQLHILQHPDWWAEAFERVPA